MHRAQANEARAKVKVDSKWGMTVTGFYSAELHQIRRERHLRRDRRARIGVRLGCTTAAPCSSWWVAACNWVSRKWCRLG